MNILSILIKLAPLVLNVSVSLVVFCLGLRIRRADLIYFVSEPELLFRSLLSMNLAMPICAVALGRLFDLKPAVEVVLLALSLSPTPSALPRKALKGGGDPAYVFSLLLVVAVLAVLAIPVGIELFEQAFRTRLNVSALAVARLVLMSVLGPLAAGMLVQRFLPSLAELIGNPLSRLGTWLLTVSIIPAWIPSMPMAASLLGNGTLVSVMAFTAAAYAIGHLLGGPKPENRTVLAIYTASRHPGMALAIVSADFPGATGAPGAMVIYLIVNAFASYAYRAWRRRRSDASPGDDVKTPA
jgi:bile acid:Na+ symporter, BASS family